MTDQCSTTYPSEDDMVHLENPITGQLFISYHLYQSLLTRIGLVIHPPSLSHDTSTPSYTLVRLSATHNNPSWHQTNLSIRPDPDDPIRRGLRWATEISQIIEHQLPRALAHRQPSPSGKGEGEASFSSDEEDLDSDLDFDSEDESEDDARSNIFGIRGVDTEDQVHLNRIRIWGMTASPGGGTSAVFISQHSTLELERDTFAGLKCRVLFGTHSRGAVGNFGHDEGMETPRDLSTEARAWEWMYGEGLPVPGFSAPARPVGDERMALRDQFDVIARRQVCVFCELPLTPQGNSSCCANGHVFGKCPVPDLQPTPNIPCIIYFLPS
jgi:hypothetical protein